jgi:hypothetical protein
MSAAEKSQTENDIALRRQRAIESFSNALRHWRLNVRQVTNSQRVGKRFSGYRWSADASRCDILPNKNLGFRLHENTSVSTHTQNS